MPATNGAAIEVPVSVFSWPFGKSVTIPTPGAETKTLG